MKRRSPCSKTAGFTLAEVLVTILIMGGILVSITQILHAARMSRDTINNLRERQLAGPAIMDLIEDGILDPSSAFATMTTNPARLMAQVTGKDWWVKDLGSLCQGTRADIAVINPVEREVVYTFVNGEMVAFEGRVIRKGYGAGGWVTRLGIIPEMGVGDITRIRWQT